MFQQFIVSDLLKCARVGVYTESYTYLIRNTDPPPFIHDIAAACIRRIRTGYEMHFRTIINYYF